MKKYISGIALFAITTSTFSLELIHPTNTAEDIVQVTLDCYAYEDKAWIAIYEQDAKLSQYGNSKKDWYYLNQGNDCVFDLAPRDKPGKYVIRLFETYDPVNPTEELEIEITTGPGRAKKAPPAVAVTDNDSFWLSLSASQFKSNTDVTVGINCHDPSATYTGRDMLIHLVTAGTTNSGKPQGTFMKDWYYLKNHQSGDPCHFVFAGREAGNYELQVFQMDETEVRAQVPVLIASSQSGSAIKQPFDISVVEHAVKKWDPVRGKNNCANLVPPASVENRCRKPITVTMLMLAGGTGYEPRDSITLASKEQKPLDFTPELSVGWFACMLDDQKCLAAQSCLADLKAKWESHFSLDNETRCNFAGKYIPW